VNPERAEIAVAVENHQRLWRGRGDAEVAFHDLIKPVVKRNAIVVMSRLSARLRQWSSPEPVRPA
jgi:hypothetical protein